MPAINYKFEETGRGLCKMVHQNLLVWNEKDYSRAPGDSRLP